METNKEMTQGPALPAVWKARVTADQWQTAQRLSEGGHYIVLSDGTDRELVAVLTALIAADRDPEGVALVTGSPDQETRITAILDAIPGQPPIRMAPAEKLALEYLQGIRHPTEFAIVADGERTLWRDSNTPVILAEPSGEPESLSPETVRQADEMLRRGRDYQVIGGEIVVCDPRTGETLPGRRFSHGLHAALQQREGLPVMTEGTTVARISIGEYVRHFSRWSAIVGIDDPFYGEAFGLSP